LETEPVAALLEPGAPWRKIQMRPDGRQVLSVSTKLDVVVWETSGLRARWTFAHEQPVSDAAFSPDNRLVVTADENGLARVWDVETGARITEVPGCGREPKLIFSPDSRRVAAYARSALKLWNARSGAVAAFELTHEGAIRTAGFSPDSKTLFTAGEDQSLRLWDSVTGQPVAKPRMHAGPVQCAQFSPDGRFVATASGDHVQVWPVGGSELQNPLHVSGERITDLVFSPGGHLLVSASEDGSARGLVLNGRDPVVVPTSAPAGLKDLEDWAALCSGRRLGANAGRLVALPGWEQRQLWLRLLNSPKQNTVEWLARWHEEQARESEREQHWFAARFHWGEALRLQPDDAALRAALARVTAAAQTADTGAPQRSNPVAGPASLPARALDTSPRLLDLSPSYNASLTESWLPLPTNVVGAGNDLAELPRGVQRFGAQSFDVRGVIQLSGGALEAVGGRFPKEAKGIRVNQHCRRLHFLHGAAWGSLGGVQIGSYRVHYRDGEPAEVRIVYGRHVREWWASATAVPLTPGAGLAWEGSNPPTHALGLKLRLYQMTWVNPRPEVEIVSLDFVSAMENSAPFLLGVTTE
jgi:hypothetical protein